MVQGIRTGLAVCLPASRISTRAGDLSPPASPLHPQVQSPLGSSPVSSTGRSRSRPTGPYSGKSPELGPQQLGPRLPACTITTWPAPNHSTGTTPLLSPRGTASTPSELEWGDGGDVSGQGDLCCQSAGVSTRSGQDQSPEGRPAETTPDPTPNHPSLVEVLASHHLSHFISGSGRFLPWSVSSSTADAALIDVGLPQEHRQAHGCFAHLWN